MANVQNRATPTQPNKRFKVHAPRTPSDPQEFARFSSELNKHLNHISDRLVQIPPKLTQDFDPDAYVKKVEFEDQLDALEQEDAQLDTSDGQEDAGGRSKKTKGRKTSRRRKHIEETAEAVIQNAIPTVAPPAIATASAVGTTTNPTLFALSDHTHKGVDFSTTGVPTQIAFFDSSNTITSDSNFTFLSTEKKLTVNAIVEPYTLAASLTIPTGDFSIYANHRNMTGSNRLTINGTGRLRGV